MAPVLIALVTAAFLAAIVSNLWAGQVVRLRQRSD